MTVSTGRGSLLLDDGQGGSAAVELTKRKVGYRAAFLPDGTPELTAELRCRGALAEVNSALIRLSSTLIPAGTAVLLFGVLPTIWCVGRLRHTI